MITFQQHIELMKSISSRGFNGFVESMKPIERIEYIRDFDKSYPIGDNIKKPKFDKRIYLNVEELVLGQFIMIEQIITGRTKLPEHKTELEILKLIIRPKQHEDFDNSDSLLESQNEKDILSFNVLEVYWVLENFMRHRNKTLFNDYAGVFYDVNDDEDDEDDDDKETSFESDFNQQWYWYSVVRMLANEDVHRYADTYMLKMNTVLPEMSYIAQRNKIESARQRQSAALRKL